MSTDRVLGGRYELCDVLGRGGMAVVHLARDIRLKRWVAVKVLRAELARDPLFRSRFRREAQAVARLNHPGIVSVHDVGHEHVEGSRADEPNVPFIVMEHVAGQSLRARLREGALTLEESIQHQMAVLSALEFSHRAGVVHRDIKPANIMVTPDGAIKVVDFGIARVDGGAGATATETHMLLGTAQYLSPEQVRGEVADARSDLYSAGCLLYELLTGRPPFVGDNPVAVAYQHVHQAPPRASAYRTEVTPALDAVLLTALAKDRKDRFQSARSFREALQSAAKGLVRADERLDMGRVGQRDSDPPALAHHAGVDDFHRMAIGPLASSTRQ
ncbi:protein kinase domain-containing protein [Micromonospora profundi]|uniref:protein kinase domain-containing protein n=1 Tax=Micromonospora TaxID=1873 RepID=UPI0006AFB330|nr:MULTISPECIES: protein kinase [Micromonospora]NJC12895.1 serine/threonine-protein kinase [Micromonospora profundi]